MDGVGQAGLAEGKVVADGRSPKTAPGPWTSGRASSPAACIKFTSVCSPSDVPNSASLRCSTACSPFSRTVEEADQTTLAQAVALDRTTTTGALKRLEARGLVSRTTSPAIAGHRFAA